MKVIKQTKSLCPECLKVLDATIFEDDNVVYIKKGCSEHGSYQEVYWSDYEQYERVKAYEYIGDGVENPRT
ncbi:MAG: radical SAM protein, partial [Candidatus Bathyarchaeia archaeon]